MAYPNVVNTQDGSFNMLSSYENFFFKKCFYIKINNYHFLDLSFSIRKLILTW